MVTLIDPRSRSEVDNNKVGTIESIVPTLLLSTSLLDLVSIRVTIIYS